MQFVDTHCHIHEALHAEAGTDATRALWHKAGQPRPAELIQNASDVGVKKILCVGTTYADSRLAVAFAHEHGSCWAAIGVHPHEAAGHLANPKMWNEFTALAKQPKVVAVGECGLDYYYGHSPKKQQQIMLRQQIELALKHDLPFVFHVRDAFTDFWKIIDEYKGVRGVVHSFSAGQAELEQVLARGLYVGLNGIMTFTKQQEQLDAAKVVPIERLLLETDAPFLTPKPFRGKVCEPKHVRVTAEFLAALRGEPLEKLARVTTANARHLFSI